MKRIAIAAVLVAVSSCGIHKPATVVTHTDSVRVEYRERIVRDTVNYTLPVIIEKNVTEDTVSVIENEYAKTAAVVHGGKLSHDLQTKPKVIRVPVEVPVRDTVYVEKKSDVTTTTVEVKVPRDLTSWEVLKLELKGWLVFSALILVGYFAAKVIRKRFPTL